jgi:type VII secretion integral membrane protein EccD
MTTPKIGGPHGVGAADLCRLTVEGPAKRADLAVPATMTMGGLLPVLLPHIASEEDRARPWVLQRLGGGPLDIDGTAESLDLREGETLYLRPAAAAMPVMEYDDVAVGVAASVEARSDGVNPAVIRRILLSGACVGLAGYAAACFMARPAWLTVVALGAAAAILIVGCVVATRGFRDMIAGSVAGLYGCAFVVLAALATTRQANGTLELGHKGVLLAAAYGVFAAAVVLVAARVPFAFFGAVLMTGASILISGWLTLAFHWPPAHSVALVAIVLFVAGGRDVRMVLRAARLRVPLLPRTAKELQEGIDPEPAEALARRVDTALGYLDSLVFSTSVMFAVACALLARGGQWADWALGPLLSVAVLLRGRSMGGAWKRAALSLSGTVGILFALITPVHDAGMMTMVELLAVLFAAASVLLVGARPLTDRRHPPIWAHLADRLEMLTALTLVPLLLQVLHVYAYFRALIS